MNKQMATLLGGATLTLLLSSTAALAQNYYQGEGVAGYNENYRGQPAYQQQNRGYSSQYYRPRTLPLPPVKTKSPVDLLETSINKVIKFLSQPQDASLEQMTFFLKKEVTPHFDFDYMSRWVAGRYYRTMPPQQRKQFTETFTELFITTFVQKMSSYKHYPPVVGDFKSKRTSEKEAMATAKIYRENGGSIQVDFKFLKTSNGWKVVDVRANGVSALLYYRNYFAEQIRRREQHQAVFQ